MPRRRGTYCRTRRVEPACLLSPSAQSRMAELLARLKSLKRSRRRTIEPQRRIGRDSEQPGASLGRAPSVKITLGGLFVAHGIVRGRIDRARIETIGAAGIERAAARQFAQ